MPHPLAVQALSGLSAAAASWQPRAADAGWRAADAWACRAALASYFCAVDLGCGAGGWAVGAAAAGLPVLGGIDGCSSALRTYATNHPSHLHACEDILDVAAVVRRVLAWHRTHGGGRPLVLLASPPCQPHSLAGLGAADGDPRLQVAAAMVQVALLTRASAILFENVEPFCTSQTWLDAADVLREEGFHVDFAVVDAGQLGLPQRRRRVICLAVRGRPTCLMAAAAAAAASQPRATVAEWFPDRRWFYHLHRRSWGQCVYDARRDQFRRCAPTAHTSPLIWGCTGAGRSTPLASSSAAHGRCRRSACVKASRRPTCGRLRSFAAPVASADPRDLLRGSRSATRFLAPSLIGASAS